MQKAVTVTNHLPKQLIEALHPELIDFIAAIRTGQSRRDIKNALQHAAPAIESLFFDHTRAEALKILRSRFSVAMMDDAALLGLLEGMTNGFQMSESDFTAAFRGKIDEFSKHSVVLAIKREWKRISGEETPDAWAFQNGIPAKYLFGDHKDGDDLLKAIEQPQTFAAKRLSEFLVLLQNITPAPIAVCQRKLMADVIPPRYRKFEIALAPLLSFLREKYGNQPNQWPPRLEVTEFIKGQYKIAIAPQIRARIKGINDAELKSKVLRLADENPELGLLFWEE